MMKEYPIEKKRRPLKIYRVYAFVLACGFLVHPFANGKQMNVPVDPPCPTLIYNAVEEETSNAIPAFWLLNAWMF